MICISYKLSIQEGISIMGLIKDLGNYFSGYARDRYDETHNQMIKILESNQKSSMLFGGYSLTANQKINTAIFINGCFRDLTFLYEFTHGDRFNLNIDDIFKRARFLSQLFLEDKLRWSKDDIRYVTDDIKIVAYQNPQIIKDIDIAALYVVANIITSEEIAKLMGHNDVSKEKGLEILNEFFIMLENSR